MSYEILYDKQFIDLQDGRYIPFVLAGSNNCFDIGPTGRERRSRSWFAYTPNGKFAATEKELLDFAESIRQSCIETNNRNKKDYPDWDNYDDKKFGYFSAIAIGGRHTSTTTYGMFKGIFKTGVKKSLTVEQARSTVQIYHGYGIKEKCEELGVEPLSIYASNTADLIEALKTAEAHPVSPYISINIHEDSLKWLRRKYFPLSKQKREKKQVDQYWAIYVKSHGYLNKFTKYGFRYSQWSNTHPFETEKQDDRMIKRAQERLGMCSEFSKVLIKQKAYV